MPDGFIAIEIECFMQLPKIYMSRGYVLQIIFFAGEEKAGIYFTASFV